MMTAFPREDQLHIDIITRSGAVTGTDKGNGKKEAKATWVRKTTEKYLTFDILKEN